MAQTAVPLAWQDPQEPATSATRHLCAGAYLDRDFRDTVISRVRHDCQHRVAPSYGFDLTAVAHHAWRAWLLETGGQALTVAVLATAAVMDPRAAVTAACGLGIWILGRVALRDLRELAPLRARSASARWLRRPVRRTDHDRLRELSRRVLVSAGGCTLLAVVGGLAATMRSSLETGIVSAAVLLGLLLAISALTAAARQRTINRVSCASSLRPARPRGRLAVIAQQESSAWVVYRRPPAQLPPDKRAAPDKRGAQAPEAEPAPFPGSGILVHRWRPPLSVQLLRPGEGSMPEREFATAPFFAHELADHIRAEMKPVGDAGDPSRLPGFAVADRIYIAETDLPDDRRFLGRPPDVADLIDDPHGEARHHLEIQVTANGEVVTTVFLRVTVRGRTLSLDLAVCALTPTPHPYRISDEYREAGLGAVLRAAGRGIADLPRALARLWRLALAPWVLAHAAWASRDRTLAPRRRRPPGTRYSVRDVTIADWDSAEPDKRLLIYNEMKIIELRILTATTDFLDSQGVDTSAFARRSDLIINAEVFNMGHLQMRDYIAPGGDAQVNNSAPSPSDPPDSSQPPQEPTS